MNAGMRTSLRAVPPPAEAAEAPTGAPNCTTCGRKTKPKPKPGPAPKAAPPGLSAAVQKMISGMPADQQALVLKSPTLQRQLQTLADRGWKVEYAKDGGGYADRTSKTIHLADGYKNVAVLAHEAGHAMYTLPPEPWNFTYTGKEQFVAERVNQNLSDEGQGQFSLGTARSEILARGGGDIGPLSIFTPSEQAVYSRYAKGEINQTQAAAQFGQIYGGYETSTTHQNYRVFYGDAAAAEWENKANVLSHGIDDLNTWWSK